MAHIWANQPARSDLRSGHRARAHPPVIDTSSVIEVCPGGAPEARNNACPGLPPKHRRAALAALSRGASEGAFREGLLKEDLIEAVVGLPTNLFYGTGIPAAVIVINRHKDKARKGKVLFIEASREFREGSAQNYLREEDVKKIAATAQAWKNVERYARVVDVAEIEKNDWNLNISSYVETAEAEVKVDVASAVAKLREAETARDAAKGVMDGFLKELGYE